MCALNVGLLISEQVFIIENSQESSDFFRCYPRSKFLVNTEIRYIYKLPVLLPPKSNSTSLCNKRIQNLLMRDLRGNYILSLNKPKTTSYGLSSFSCVLAKLRNALPDFVRTTEFTGFKLENPRQHFVRQLFFLLNISLNTMYLDMYLYMLCILVVNVMSRRHWLS